ncbi:DUF2795 domain-containing protein [Streptomyces sp. ISL-99]|uniref:DUF2795 domain-containing protein n=1 Tax=Streptomyces sp. ISL-99 TaxID=2819193 RepID=UPI001BE64435|nr:DUF2795 domain-containing protein [Streptomyces sp. ISL-99]MBT2529376.1 DUF2795 domain-containing protein [Streptomyces sp. ISL-99]
MNVNPIEMQKSLGGVSYPASKKQIVETAKNNRASREITKALEALPEKEYDSPAAINKEVGK